MLNDYPEIRRAIETLPMFGNVSIRTNSPEAQEEIGIKGMVVEHVNIVYPEEIWYPAKQ